MNRQRNECHLGTVKPYEQKTRGKIDPQSPESESLTFAGSSVCYGSCHVSVKALLAVVAVAACSVVAAVHADPSALSPRQLIQLHVESAATGMEVAVTRCRGKVNIFSCGIASANVSRKKVYNIFTVFTLVDSKCKLAWMKCWSVHCSKTYAYYHVYHKRAGGDFPVRQ